jgi:hypothetical protein
VSQHGVPAPTLLLAIRGLSVSIRHRWKPGRAATPAALPPPAPPPPPGTGTLAPTNIIRVRRRRQWWLPAMAGTAAPSFVSSVFHPAVSPRRLRPGRAGLVQFVPPVFAFPVSGSPILRPVGSGRRPVPRRRWIWAPRALAAPPSLARFAGPLLVQRRGDAPLRRRPGWMLHWLPIPLGGTLTNTAIAYHVYGNSGNGPINYSVILATVTGLTWTSDALAYPADWKFGVRAFNGCGEEQNVDVAVEIILDATGHDITNRPAAPIGLRAFARAGGAIRVEWAYPIINRPKTPTGFHVYVGLGGPPPDYTRAIATVLYTAGRAGTFVADLPPASLVTGNLAPTSPVRVRRRRQRWTGAALSSTDGVLYTIGVRAYNAAAEEPNTNTVTVTADATGPGPVDQLTGMAI